MADEKDPAARPTPPGASKEEIALELMKFVAVTTGYGKGAAAGFAGKAPKTADEQVDALLNLYGRCLTALNK
jgi:hypothetical protein